MLDNDTKRKIDNCRDILVGKIPDPRLQAEQITLALIYKFMDDMDIASEKIGWAGKFFEGEYKDYNWRKITSKATDSSEAFDSYIEAIQKMSKNEKIPKLFRDIFQNAYIPYRDPQILRLFLKEIDGFTYDHSERLGDAFEYLLSILGSQGDAGQFRTPRHIIDFMVDIIDPKKDETILDPACGTGGFLISAYKHILKNNSSNPEEEGWNLGDLLKSDERKKLAKNIEGYDISPDMIRLSLVNMYLHHIKSPRIFEYNTLTDTDRWEDFADIILANPPFMTPKGGIKPHNRFSFKSNRSEALFVDYIAEHLNIRKGRAAVIVPEGILFRIETAYKKLRKMLVEKCLIAVISLPSGAFNPYTGVKCSILIFDRALVKKTDKVLFARIDNDGFHLGSQRHSIGKNDIPIVSKGIKEWLSSIRNGKKLSDNIISQLCEVSRNEIKNTDNYNLSSEKYASQTILLTDFPMVDMGEVAYIKRGNTITKKQTVLGDIPVIAGGQNPAYYHNEYNRTGKTITVSGSGAYAGFVNFFNYPIFASDCSTIKPKENSQLDITFLYNFLKSIQNDIYALQKGAGQPHVYPSDLADLKIPLPPIETQKIMVAEIEKYQMFIEYSKEIITSSEAKIRGIMERIWSVQ